MPRAKKRQDGLYQKSVTINGKRHVFYGKSQSEITRKILNFEERERNGPTFKEVADEWETNIEPTLAYTTYSRYKPCIRRAVEAFGCSYITQIDVTDIHRYITSFALSPKGKARYSSKTVKTQLGIFNMIFKYAILRGYTKDNPCAYVPIPKGLPKKARELPDDCEIKKVINGVNKPFGLFAYLILYSGLRRGEALALTYNDIDKKDGVIHVTKSLYHESNVPHIKTPKTAAGERDVLLLNCLSDVLPRTTSQNRDKPLFPNGNGEYMTAGEAKIAWRDYCRETDLKVTAHQLRHAYATILYNAGVGDKDAQTLLGHSTIAMTRDIYTHISDKQKEATRSKLNSFICSNNLQAQ